MDDPETIGSFVDVNSTERPNRLILLPIPK
jgi:hypothetical protein